MKRQATSFVLSVDVKTMNKERLGKPEPPEGTGDMQWRTFPFRLIAQLAIFANRTFVFAKEPVQSCNAPLLGAVVCIFGQHEIKDPNQGICLS
mmetsp:Transcript_21608/g.67756  ORF Transcript_21608/g.67756 Transcript_21608/m.67756 type:complete len:93 (+) Transcript_21608:340-618(+)